MILTVKKRNTGRGLLLALLIFAAQARAEKEYLFSVVPQQSAVKTAHLWTPLLKSLQQRTGYRFRLITAADIPRFERDLAAGKADFSYMNPYHYTVFHRSQGYRALVRARDRVIHGIVVVRKDSAIATLQDLKGRELAFPAPAAFAATLLPRGTLRQQGIDIHSCYVGSHDSVYLNVARGFYPAGGGIRRTLKNMPAQVRDQLRILWTSPGYTPHAIAVHPRVPAKVATAVRDALLALNRDEGAGPMLRALKFKGFAAASDEDWDDVRALGLDVLHTGKEDSAP